MMTRLFHYLVTLLLVLVVGSSARAQEVAWRSDVEPLEGGRYRVTFTAEIPPMYHIYDLGPYADGPTATTFVFAPNGAVTWEGTVEQLDTPKRYYDEIFDCEIGTFERRARFARTATVSDPTATVEVTVTAMMCTDKRCLPPTDYFLTVNFSEASAAEAAAVTSADPADPADLSATPAVTETAAPVAPSNLWALIVEAILWGLAAMLTPCVFPMIPMTVSYFLKSEGGAARGRLRALLYGGSIVALYTLPVALLILVTRWVGGDATTAGIFNLLATHWLPNLIFFVVFMLFAASFFGAFELTLPSWLATKSDARASTTGFVGIFFLALTLVLVSFSCTGPIVGMVLIKSTSGEFWTPILTMLAFSVTFALPFALFAFFPEVLKKLPKSGGWLNSVKVVIGFIELALGMKFLSVADQTYHWGLLDREVYLAIWIVIFALLGLYLLGKIRFAHDAEVTHIGVLRLALVIATFSFVVYLLPGMWGAPLKALSGYLPPITTQDFVMNAAPAAPTTAAQSSNALPAQRKYADKLHLPHGLEGFFDLAEATEYAARVHKPLFIDFTGHGCVNCREMEARVWSNPEVLQLLRDEYVIVALYVDDKMEVAAADQVTTETGRVLKTLGQINAYNALKNYGVNAQPYYLLQSPDGRTLTEPRQYDLDVAGFIAFLKAGIVAM